MLLKAVVSANPLAKVPLELGTHVGHRAGQKDLRSVTVTNFVVASRVRSCVHISRRFQGITEPRSLEANPLHNALAACNEVGHFAIHPGNAARCLGIQRHVNIGVFFSNAVDVNSHATVIRQPD